MYERFYGLSRTPFAVTPDPLMLFMSRIHREALATIIYGVETRKGFIVCTGEVGTGKSTIIRAFFDQAGADAVKLIYIFMPQVTPLEMASFICRELELEDPESVFAAVPRLQLKLLEVFESGRTVVLMIDEAQLLPPETLEFLRLLSNFETDTEKLIQIVLVGQPEVDTMLARRDMRQVNQRVALRARLGAFSVEESFDYIDHRLRVSGAGDLTQVMSPSAAWLIAEAAAGIPRRINILADNALIAGFGAAQRPLGSRLAGIAVREFIAKSGAARSAASERFGSGWRAARRLRSALVREKEEPVDWIAAAPPANRPVTDPASPQVIRPASRPAIRPASRRPANHGAATPDRAAAFASAQLGGVGKPVEPEAGGWQVSPVAAGEPISAADIAIIAPAAQANPNWIAFADDEREWVGYEPTTRAPGMPAPPPASEPGPAHEAKGAAASPAASAVSVPVTVAPADRPLGPTMQWPALSRVRTGLQMAPRREPVRALPDPGLIAEG